jgi:hypothetical protein
LASRPDLALILRDGPRAATAVQQPCSRWDGGGLLGASAGFVLIGVSALILVLMTETESLIAEVRQLRADVARLHSAVLVRHSWINMIFKDLSTNPHTQYKVHMWGAIYWLINFPLVCCLFFLTPTLWLKLGIFITLIYSIYANLATDYGGMSAAEAAFGQPQPPPIPLEPPLPQA